MSKKDSIIGSPLWMSPEMIAKSEYNDKTDIWSVGITAIELAEGNPPYSNLKPINAMFLIQQSPPTGLSTEAEHSKEFVSFVQECLTFNPDERPSAIKMLDHPFINRRANTHEMSLLFNNISDKIHLLRSEGIHWEDGLYKEQLNGGDVSTNETGTMIIKNNNPNPPLGSDQDNDSPIGLSNSSNMQSVSELLRIAHAAKRKDRNENADELLRKIDIKKENNIKSPSKHIKQSKSNPLHLTKSQLMVRSIITEGRVSGSSVQINISAAQIPSRDLYKSDSRTSVVDGDRD